MSPNKNKLELETICRVTEWLSSFKDGDVRGTVVLNYGKAHSICNMVSQFNQSHRFKGLFYHGARIYCGEHIVVIVVCESRETYLNNVKNGNK